MLLLTLLADSCSHPHPCCPTGFVSSSARRLTASLRGTGSPWHLLQSEPGTCSTCGHSFIGSPRALTCCCGSHLRLVEGSSLRIIASDIDLCPGSLLLLTWVRCLAVSSLREDRCRRRHRGLQRQPMMASMVPSVLKLRFADCLFHHLCPASWSPLWGHLFAGASRSCATVYVTLCLAGRLGDLLCDTRPPEGDLGRRLSGA